MTNLKRCDCGGKIKVVDVRPMGNEIWRRRQCEKCRRITYTAEAEVSLAEDSYRELLRYMNKTEVEK